MKIKKLIFLIPVCLLFFTNLNIAHAHPADIYAHTIYITISQAELHFKWEIKPGPMLTSYLWYEADANQDGTLSQQEADNWGRARAALLTAKLDDMPLPLLVESVQMPSDLQSFEAGQEFITFTLSAKLPQGTANTHRLILNNGMEPKTSINWFYLSAIENTAFLFPAQQNNTITIDLVQNRTLVTDQSKLLTDWDSGTLSLPVGQQKDVVTETAKQVVPKLAQRTPQEILLDLVRTKDFSVSFYVFALGVSLALGALHALTPGHGKTVVAAYLVGSRGTAQHAIVLGSVVTLTHTGSVFLLGIITLVASQYILPTSIIPMLEVASGLMIVSLGFYLLWQRFFYWQKTISSSSPILPPKGEESHPFSQAEKVKMRRVTPLSSTAKRKPDAITIQKVPENFQHHGDGKLHTHVVPESITWRSLITLGISGGLVPCPDAIAILLVAIAINRIFLGLALIVSFSLGLAIVLITIGLLMVSSSHLIKRMDAFNKFAPFMPMISALIVLFLGFGLTYGAVTSLDSRSSPSLTGIGSATNAAHGAVTSLNSGPSPSLTGTGLATNAAHDAVPSLNSGPSPSLTGTGFVTNAAQIIYLNDDKNKQKQLFVTDTKGSEPFKLTDAATDVVDFAISPDQTRIIYVAQTEDIKNELWMLDLNNKENKLVVSCGEAICSQPVWSPDGKHIVYEYTLIDAGTSSLWWLDITTKKAQPVFQEARLPGTNPCWSPNGEWLSYATPDGIRLSNLISGESRLIPNILGAAVQWSPDNKSILIRDVLVNQNQYQYDTQLFLYDLASKTLTNVNANVTMDNILAAWSPDGKFIAVVRSDLNIPRGDQIWLMRADGSEAHVITNMPAVSHGSLNWSPDGKYILYDLYLLDSIPLTSRLEVVDIENRQVTNLNVIGYNPKWIWQS